MDLKQLRYFTTVAEEGTISAAAKKLFMSQPPLSTQMKLLEQELGAEGLDLPLHVVHFSVQGEDLGL